MTAILVDDEKIPRNAGVDVAEELSEVEIIIAMCDSPLDGLWKIKTLKPDVIFWTLKMPQLNGFDLLERLGKHTSNVIFTTTHNQFAIKGLLKFVRWTIFTETCWSGRFENCHSESS